MTTRFCSEEAPHNEKRKLQSSERTPDPFQRTGRERNQREKISILLTYFCKKSKKKTSFLVVLDIVKMKAIL